MNINYYCFIVDDLKEFLYLVKDICSFTIDFKLNKKQKKMTEIEDFFLTDVRDFSLVVDYQFESIDNGKLTIADIYNQEIKKGSDLNLKLGLYVTLSKKNYNEFQYFETKQ